MNARLESLQLATALRDDTCAPAERLLGSVWHGSAAADSGADVWVPLPLLIGDAAGLHEAWCGMPVTHTGRHGSVRFRRNEEIMFLAVDVEPDAGDIGAITRRAYDALFAALRAEGFTWLARCWNYIPYINAEQHDVATGTKLERYRVFNVARQQAFAEARHSIDIGAPAACALGSHTGGLVLYALASRVAPLSIENPRQVSAYHYPQQYGPRSPTFSRAAVLSLSGETQLLFVSGTASIVGHESVHLGDVIAQTEESLRNIRSVVEQANVATASRSFAMERLCFKVFVRDAAQAPMVAEAMRRELGADVSMAFLEADVCRSELLVEIEASGLAGAKG